MPKLCEVGIDTDHPQEDVWVLIHRGWARGGGPALAWKEGEETEEG